MFKEIVLGEVIPPTQHFNKYEFTVQFDDGNRTTFVVEPKEGLRMANLLQEAVWLAPDYAYKLLGNYISNWPIEESGEWAGIEAFSMKYYNFKGVKHHVTLK